MRSDQFFALQENHLQSGVDLFSGYKNGADDFFHPERYIARSDLEPSLILSTTQRMAPTNRSKLKSVEGHGTSPETSYSALHFKRKKKRKKDIMSSVCILRIDRPD